MDNSIIENLSMSETEMETRREFNDRVFLPSKYSFAMEHKGFRAGSIHGILGGTGSGKTTLVRGITLDVAKHIGQDEKVFLWLSEESKSDYKTNLSYQSNLYTQDVLEKLMLFSEVDQNLNAKELVQKIEQVLSFEKVKFLIIDNVTTGEFFNSSSFTERESKYFWIKALAAKFEIPVLVVIHTAKNTNHNNLITEDNVRNSGTISNICQYFYTIQTFIAKSQGKDVKGTFLFVRKSRNHTVQNPTYYLPYQKELRTFPGDEAIEFEQFKEFFNKRNKL